MEKLAIFGGTPVRKSPISYGKQWIEEDDIQAVTNVLRGDYLTCGPYITQMEEKNLPDYRSKICSCSE